MQASYDDIFAASQKIALTTNSLLVYILPPLACQYLMAVLVQLEGTRFHRLAILPVFIWLTWRAIFVDMSGGDPNQGQTNSALITHMWSISMRAVVWALAREPFRREDLLNKHEKSDSVSVYTALWNAWDLMLGVRGIGWNWRPRGLVVPKPAFETDSRVVFVSLSAGRLALFALGFDACVQGIRMASPDTFGSLNGGSLFDHTLPLLLELLRAALVSFLAVWLTYFAIQWGYQLIAIICITLFQQRPSQWPPLFDSPWLSTSLTELWGRRWHQLMRELLVGLGIQPFGHLFGRLGGLFAAFLLSGIFHDIELRSFGRGGKPIPVIGFWVMNCVGVILERVWRRTTGRRVGGVWGWMWTFGWLLLWGVWVVDEWAKSGRFGVLSLPGDIHPAVALVGLVRGTLLGR